MWERARRRRIRVGATVWQGLRFDDDSLFGDRAYQVARARKIPWGRPRCPMVARR
jgi:hypothetical protein